VCSPETEAEGLPVDRIFAPYSFFNAFRAFAFSSHFSLLLFGENIGKPGHLGD
jgi:hypothetical protein